MVGELFSIIYTRQRADLRHIRCNLLAMLSFSFEANSYWKSMWSINFVILRNIRNCVAGVDILYFIFVIFVTRGVSAAACKTTIGMRSNFE